VLAQLVGKRRAAIDGETGAARLLQAVVGLVVPTGLLLQSRRHQHLHDLATLFIAQALGVDLTFTSN